MHIEPILKKISRKLNKIAKLTQSHLNVFHFRWLDCLGQKSELKFLLGKTGYNHLKKIILYSDTKADALLKAAEYLAVTGLPNHAIQAYEALLAIEQKDAHVHIYLQSLMYSSPEKYSHQYVYDAHVKWGQWLQCHPKYTKHANPKTSNRRLKIGYTCHFITNSTSTTLLLPILKAHHRDRVEIFMYSDEDASQTTTVSQLAENWRNTKDLTNNEFCELVYKDQIDILFELNGHCAQNRYRALTRKPAPIQVTYYNYSSTCGIPGIDYVLLGEEFKLNNLQPFYSEKMFYKKGVVIATPLSNHFPEISPPPVLKNGYVTFGSFGQAHKVNREQIKLWCDVLLRVPNSKFYMKASALSCPIQRSVFAHHFIANGIDTNRVILEGPSDYASLLNAYSNMDIALDTYPFNGGTTPIEAIMQGVPTITLIGERFCSQHGICNMHNAGHNEFICDSKQEFIQKAVALANDTDKLKHYRYSLRNDLIQSPRGNMEKFITEFENACQAMWQNYLEEHA